MLFTSLFAIQFLILPRTISATPLPYHPNHAKRSTSSQNVRSGVVITICILFLAAIFYYLGMRHERTKSWFSKRNLPAQPELSCGSGVNTERQRHKRQISCPLAVSSSAPIKPYDDPIEVPTPSLRYYEMPVEEIHEMGLPSPKKPPPRASWLSLDRKPWWLICADDKQQGGSEGAARSQSMPSWFKSAKSNSSIAHKQASAPLPDVTYAYTLEAGRRDLKDMERASDGSTLLDWSGLEYVRRFYVERKSRIGL